MRESKAKTRGRSEELAPRRLGVCVECFSGIWVGRYRPKARPRGRRALVIWPPMRARDLLDLVQLQYGINDMMSEDKRSAKGTAKTAASTQASP